MKIKIIREVITRTVEESRITIPADASGMQTYRAFGRTQSTAPCKFEVNPDGDLIITQIREVGEPKIDKDVEEIEA